MKGSPAFIIAFIGQIDALRLGSRDHCPSMRGNPLDGNAPHPACSSRWRLVLEACNLDGKNRTCTLAWNVILIAWDLSERV